MLSSKASVDQWGHPFFWGRSIWFQRYYGVCLLTPKCLFRNFGRTPFNGCYRVDRSTAKPGWMTHARMHASIQADSHALKERSTPPNQLSTRWASKFGLLFVCPNAKPITPLWRKLGSFGRAAATFCGKSLRAKTKNRLSQRVALRMSGRNRNGSPLLLFFSGGLLWDLDGSESEDEELQLGEGRPFLVGSFFLFSRGPCLLVGF